MSTPIILRIYKNNQLFLVKQFEQSQIFIGSSGADVEIEGDEIMPLHAMIEKRGELYYLTDLGTESGTFCNGSRILEIELDSNSRFQISTFEIAFSLGVPKSVEKRTEPKAIPVKAETQPPVLEKQSAPVTKKTKIHPPALPTLPSVVAKSGTYAPDSQTPVLTDYIKPSKGPVVEVLVAWGNRILHCYHFKRPNTYRTGGLGKSPIFIPASVLPRGWPLVEIKNDTSINLPVGSQLEVVDSEKKWNHEELDRKGRVQKNLDKSHFKLKQGEVLFVKLSGTDLLLIFRQVPPTNTAPLSTPFLLSTDEWLGLIGSLVIMSVFILYVMARVPTESEEKPIEIERVAKIIVERPPQPLVPVKKEKIVEIKEDVSPQASKPPDKPEKVKLDDKSQQATEKGKSVAQGKKQIPKKATEAAPKLFKNLPKKYTSVKQGGGVKLGDRPGGNASSDQNPKEFGLLGALGAGGVREKIDQAYKGSGEVIGMNEQATGSSGFDADRKGQDLGSKVQDTGAGGKGIATHGISGVGVKGKSAGMSEYGSSKGLGDKSRVQVVAGGSEEAFVGSIDKEAVRRVIRENIREIQSCYERGLNQLPKGSRLEGRVTIKWTIVAKGEAEDVKVKESSLGNQKIENCIRDRIASWNYPEPPPGLEGVVEYPFYLKPIN